MSPILPLLLLAAACVEAPADPPGGAPAGRPLVVTLGEDGAVAAVVAEVQAAGGDAAVDGARRKVPYLGIVTSALPPAVRAQTDLGEDIGLSVDSVAPDSPAAKAGLAPFDILARYDDQILCAPLQLSALVKRTGSGKAATLTVIRRGKEMPIEVTVGEHEAPAALAIGPAGGAFGAGLPRIVAGRPLDEATVARLREQAERAARGGAAAGAGGAPGWQFVPVPGALPAEQRFILVNPAVTRQSQSTSMHSDDRGQVIFRETDGVMTVTVLDRGGAVQYQGPWGGEGDPERVPEELRGRVEEAAGRRAQAPPLPRGGG
jgi:hypothetical protein